MVRRACALLILVAAGSLPAWPQASGPAEIKVRVSTIDDRPAPKHLRVELTTASELYISSSFTDDEGRAEFSARPGNYRIRVSGIDIEEAVTPVFTVYRGDSTQFQHVRVALKGGANARVKTSTATISQTSLNVPSKAQKEYDKAGKAMKAGNWTEAQARLERAIVLYPQFAAAHNDLGVVFMSTGSKSKGHAAFEKAAQIDPNYGPACRNLAIMNFTDGNPAEALSWAEKALAADPLDPQALLLLAQMHFQAGRMEEAAARARQVHEAPHETFAVAHLIAARALEASHLTEEAAAEYKLFLSEAPNSPSAPKARDALQKLTAKAN